MTAYLTASDPEPPPGTVVIDADGRKWRSWIDSWPCHWLLEDGDERSDPESWIKVAGNYGPVQVVEVEGRAVSDDVKAIVRAWLMEHAYAPDDVVLGDRGLTDAQLPDLYLLLDRLDPTWREIFETEEPDSP